MSSCDNQHLARKKKKKSPYSSIQGFWGLISLSIWGSFSYCPYWPSHGRLFFIPLIHSELPRLHSVSSLPLKHSSTLFGQEKVFPHLYIQLNSICFGKPPSIPHAGLDCGRNIWFIIPMCHCFMTTYVISTCIWCPSPDLQAPNTGPRIHLTSNGILILPSNN